MATDLNYIKYVVEQIDLPDISFKKMFGEYMVYYKAVPVLLVCDDCVFVKILKETTELLGEDCEQEFPYDGAKLHYVLDIDNSDLARQTVMAVYNCRKDKPKKSKQQCFYLPEFSGFFIIILPCSEKVFFMESAVLLIFGMVVRNKSKNCQYLIIM